MVRNRAVQHPLHHKHGYAASHLPSALRWQYLQSQSHRHITYRAYGHSSLADTHTPQTQEQQPPDPKPVGMELDCNRPPQTCRSTSKRTRAETEHCSLARRQQKRSQHTNHSPDLRGVLNNLATQHAHTTTPHPSQPQGTSWSIANPRSLPCTQISLKTICAEL